MKKGFYIITGAGSGIGQELARQAAKDGNKVVITDINQKGLKQTEADIQKMGGWVRSYLFDISQLEEIQKFAQDVLQNHAPENIILINNAGVALGSGHFEDTELKDFEWLLNINLWGVIRTTKAFLPYMIEKNQGHIVNISSVFGLGGFVRQSAYCTAKFGVKGFTDVLKMELIGKGVKATSVHPGGIKTNIARNSRNSTPLTKEQFEKEVDNTEKMFKTTSVKAAETILKGISKNKTRILIGNDARMIDFFTRFFPNTYHKILARFVPKPLVEV